MGKKLERTTFQTSRLLEFCSEKELTNQTGHERRDWPLVVLKELADNALDACEEAGVPPEVKVKVDAAGITITDNGPGIPPETVDGVLDYGVRVSSREAYVSPCRGAQGNALKTILAMPFALDGHTGRVDIMARGERHEITFGVDEIRQVPAVSRTVHEAPNVKTGTLVEVHWPVLACSELEDAKGRFLQLADDYTFLNPHLTLSVDWFGTTTRTRATDPGWKKWLPSRPTSPHWYSAEDAGRLVAAYISHDQDAGVERFVGQFIREFHGLTGTAAAKAVLEASGLGRRTKVSELANGVGLEREIIDRLFRAMKERSKAIKPPQLGIIGKDHIAKRFKAAGCVMESFQYKMVAKVGEDGLPAVIETAFGWRGDQCQAERRIVTGVNWSPGIVNPFRTLGATSCGDGVAAALVARFAGPQEPIVFLLHAASPRVRYLDRGKSSVVTD